MKEIQACLLVFTDERVIPKVSQVITFAEK